MSLRHLQIPSNDTRQCRVSKRIWCWCGGGHKTDVRSRLIVQFTPRLLLVVVLMPIAAMIALAVAQLVSTTRVQSNAHAADEALINLKSAANFINTLQVRCAQLKLSSSSSAVEFETWLHMYEGSPNESGLCPEKVASK